MNLRSTNVSEHTSATPKTSSRGPNQALAAVGVKVYASTVRKRLTRGVQIRTPPSLVTVYLLSVIQSYEDEQKKERITGETSSSSFAPLVINRYSVS